MEQVIIESVIQFVSKYPLGASALIFIGVFRVIFKPTMTYLHSVADATPSLKDNEILAKIEANRFYKALAWFADFAFSIKLPSQK